MYNLTPDLVKAQLADSQSPFLIKCAPPPTPFGAGDPKYPLPLALTDPLPPPPKKKKKRDTPWWNWPPMAASTTRNFRANIKNEPPRFQKPRQTSAKSTGFEFQLPQ